MNEIEFQIRESATSRQQPYWWRIVSKGNGKVLASSEMYANFADALAAVRLVINGSSTAKIINYTSVRAA